MSIKETKVYVKRLNFEVCENDKFTIEYTEIEAISPYHRFVCVGGDMTVDYINMKNKMVADRKQTAMLVFARCFENRLFCKVNKSLMTKHALIYHARNINKCSVKPRPFNVLLIIDVINWYMFHHMLHINNIYHVVSRCQISIHGPSGPLVFMITIFYALRVL